MKRRDEFIKVLGEGYKSRPLDMETYRYKWHKGVFIIRADFDKKGILKGEKKISRGFSGSNR
ncbi:hypothetical protein [Terrimonas sp.]|uniref:hypothetical protein n=1 Tax=Terrimonas sp. TaxID=1914338 RepID=UPI001057131E|nr:hypothetical protein [Terrimonas sp.]